MFEQLTSQLGLLYWPLMLSALLAAIIIIERLLIMSYVSISGSLSRQAALLMSNHEHCEVSLREELMATWLLQRQRKLLSGLSMLQMIAMISPLMGLLGTVLGLIQAFETIGAQAGPVQPAMLAGGLGFAMNTTAAGLIIALPALIAAHILRIWVDKLIAHTEHGLNLQQLESRGIAAGVLR